MPIRITLSSFEYDRNLIGGAGVYALELSRWLERYCALSVYSCAAYQTPPDAFAAAWCGRGASNVTYKRLPKLLRHHGVMAFYYYALFQQRPKEGDVYLVNDLSPGVAPYRNQPIVQIAHHLPSSELNQPSVSAKARVGLTLLASLERRAFKRARVIICQSKDTMQRTRLRYPEEAGKLTMIPNGVDVELFKPADDERTDDGSVDTPVILCVARGLEARKGISHLIEAFAATQRVTDAKLIIIGKDSQGLKRHFLARVRALGVANAVTFIDSVSLNDLIDLYRRATLTVVPSLLEGFSKPALESMACGTPVIGSAVGAMPELVDEGSGVLVPPGDTGSLTAALLDLLRDVGRTTRMGVAARGRVIACFAWDVIARKVLDVCETAASG